MILDLILQVYEQQFLGLLDTGANRTILKKPDWIVLKPHCVLSKVLRLPIELAQKVKVMEILVVPSLHDTSILEMDYWHQT